jgi:uncharacterized SAM-binding protein YcdF (DUF218 family)
MGAAEETRKKARRPRHRILFAGAALAVGLFFLGFVLFSAAIERFEVELTSSADGIVVLTGGASRISDAVELLAENRGKRLLISGVHPTTTPGEIARVRPELQRLFSCCIDLGRHALNTVGNAVETAQWVRERGFHSLIVVTSAWHMPRALVELKRELPDVELIPYPVVSERMREEPWWASAQTARLLLVEYVKYVASYAGLRLDPTITDVNPPPSGGSRS